MKEKQVLCEFHIFPSLPQVVQYSSYLTSIAVCVCVVWQVWFKPSSCMK